MSKRSEIQQIAYQEVGKVFMFSVCDWPDFPSNIEDMAILYFRLD